MHPPGKEKATRQGGSLGTDNTESLTDPQTACNSKPLPPGSGWEGGKIVPCEEHPTRQPESVTESEMFRRLSAVFGWIDDGKISVKWHSALVALGQDTRTPSEIAEQLGVSSRLVQLRIAEARKVLAEGEEK